MTAPAKLSIWRICRRIHRWLGLWSGLYVVFICLTGSILIYKPEIERAHAHGYVTPGAARYTWQQLQDIVRAEYPDAVFTHLELPANPTDAPYFRLLTRAGRIYVYVDPHTSRILGHDPPNSFTWFVYDLHSRKLNGWGAILTAAMLITGFTVRRRDPHSRIGMITVAPLLLITITGAMILFIPNAPAPAAGSGRPLPLDMLLARAPEVRSLRFYPNRAWLLRTAREAIWIDPPTGAIVKRETPRPLGALHYGTFFGPVNRIAWLLTGLAGAALFVTGFRRYHR